MSRSTPLKKLKKAAQRLGVEPICKECRYFRGPGRMGGCEVFQEEQYELGTCLEWEGLPDDPLQLEFEA